MTIENQELLTVRDVARKCQRSEETVRRWIWSGKLRAKKLGNQLFVDPRDLEDLGRTREPRLAGFEIPKPRYTKKEMLRLMERDRKLREELFKKYGYFDVAAIVRESRESH